MGKTEAGKYFIKNKIDVFDCDKEIATFYNKNDTIIEIKKIFPSTVYNNKVDKNALANIVFNDKKKLNFFSIINVKSSQVKGFNLYVLFTFLIFFSALFFISSNLIQKKNQFNQLRSKKKRLCTALILFKASIMSQKI